MAIEKWMLVNLTNKPISPGFLNMTVVYPGRSKDLIGSSVTKDEVRQSNTIATYLKNGTAKIERMLDGKVVSTITGENLSDLNDIPQENVNDNFPKKHKAEKVVALPPVISPAVVLKHKLIDHAPTEMPLEHFALYVEGDHLMIHAKDKKGRVLNAKLGEFKNELV